jgi:GrpB-like predicted nucleotidyltransferase (UPF0157 family)
LNKNISSKPNEHRRVVVIPYQLDWLEKYEIEAAKLMRIFLGEAVQIHHIGSTSIPGMPAKPIIDMLMVVKDIQKIDDFNAIMENNGYTPKGENGIPGRRFFYKGDEMVHIYHLHVFQSGSSEIQRHLAFRDYLIAHPEEAQQYAKLKIGLSNQFPYNIDAYQDGKEELIIMNDYCAADWLRRKN